MEIARASLLEYRRRGGQELHRLRPRGRGDARPARPWPGNVRQLLNVIRNVVVLHDGPLVRPGDAAGRDRRPGRVAAGRARRPHAAAGRRDPRRAPTRARVELLVGTPLADVERELIEATIAHCDGSIPRAARDSRRLALDPLPQARELDRGAAPLRHLTAPCQAAAGGAHSRAAAPGGSPWTCSTPRSASARTPTRPIPASRSAPRIRCPDGRVFAGCNVENVAYPGGHLRRGRGDRRDGRRRRAARSPRCWSSPTARPPVTPCGGCRQKLAEFAAPEVPVILAGLGGELARTTVGALLPGAFGAGAHGAGRAMTDLRAAAARALACLDLTNLDEACDAAAIDALCAPRPHAARAGGRGLHLAARSSPRRTTALAGSGIRVATVVNFPAGDDDVLAVRDGDAPGDRRRRRRDRHGRPLARARRRASRRRSRRRSTRSRRRPRHRNAQGDPRDRRARGPGADPPRRRRGAGRRRRLPQDLDRQGPGQRHPRGRRDPARRRSATRAATSA